MEALGAEEEGGVTLVGGPPENQRAPTSTKTDAEIIYINLRIYSVINSFPSKTSQSP